MGYWQRGEYYVRSVRDGVQVRTEYFGSGLLGTLAAETDALRAAARDEERRLNREAREAFQGDRRQAARLGKALAAALESYGLHRGLNRGQWRRRKAFMGTMAVQTRSASQFADLARLAESALLSAFAGELPDFHADVTAKMEQLRTELAGPGQVPAPLRLAVDMCVLSWATFYIAEINAARAASVPSALAQQCLWAHRKYAQSIKVMETIRRLSKPRPPRVAIQINHNGNGHQNGNGHLPPALDVEANHRPLALVS